MFFSIALMTPYYNGDDFLTRFREFLLRQFIIFTCVPCCDTESTDDPGEVARFLKVNFGYSRFSVGFGGD